MQTSSGSDSSRRTVFKLVSLKDERLERKLALAFGFMSFIPILLITWAMVSGANLGLVLPLMALSAFIGYFVVARRMVQSVMNLSHRVEAISKGQALGQVAGTEQNEIGELARAFNRITQELEHKIDELESSRALVKKLLSRIGTAIISYEGIDNVLNLILENTAGALQAQRGSLMLVDGSTQELEVKTAWSHDGRQANGAYRVKSGDGIVGWVLKEGRPMRNACSPADLGFAADEGSNGEGAVLCVPLKLREQAIGVVTMVRDDCARSFTDDDQALLLSIAAQIAVAIENYRLNLDIEQTYVQTVMALAMAVEAKDAYSAGHSKRVGFYAKQLGQALGLDEAVQRDLDFAGVLHDLGKIGVKDDILLKRGRLSPEEEKIIQQHPLIGEAILKPIRSMRRVAHLVRCHHERYDGTGYPSGLKGEEIPLEARILSVADAYDSMITDRPYRKRYAASAAQAELRECAGTQYDPKIVAAFLQIVKRREPPTPPDAASSLPGEAGCEAAPPSRPPVA